MRKLLTLLLAFVLCFGLAACGSAEKDNGGNGGNGGNEGGGNEQEDPKVDYSTYGSYWFPQHDYRIMPVTAYNSCPPKEGSYSENLLTEESLFRAYSEAGVNTMMGLTDYVGSHLRDVTTALDYCYDYNLAYLLAYAGASSVKSESMVRSTLATIMSHDNFAGIMLSDEPGRVMYEDLATARGIFDKVLGETSEKLYHVNLFPTYANQKQLYFRSYTDDDVVPGGSYTYEQYLADYMELYRPRVLSYDFYPIQDSFPCLMNGYFENMSVIRAAALEANIPFWTYIQTCSFAKDQRLPTESDLLWNVNTCLAYGAKGIQYFCGVVPNDTNEQFNGAMFDRDGKPTAIYDLVKKANKQIAAVDEVLMCAKSKGIMQIGLGPKADVGRMEVPASDRIEKYGELTGATANHALIGCFDYNGKTALYVVNNAIADDDEAGAAADTVVLNFASSVSGYRVTDGVKTDFSGTSLSLALPAGQAALVVIG